MVAFELGMIAIMIWSHSAGWIVFAIFAALFGALALLVTVGVCFGETKLEDQIENELRKCMERAGNNESS